MLLYHGTDLQSAINIYDAQTVDLSIGAKTVDFGPGFYTTDDISRARKWAQRKAIARRKPAALVTITFDKEAASPFIESFCDDIRWGRFVINNRNGINYIAKVPFKEHNLDARYDIPF